MPITFPSNTTEIIDEIRGAIGREVIFNYVAGEIACTICDLDPVTNTSIDSFCPVCSGAYWIPVISGYTISGHVTWATNNELAWVVGGQYFDGDCRVQVKFSNEFVTILDSTEWVDIDGKELEIKKRIYRGVPTINRILIDLIER